MLFLILVTFLSCCESFFICCEIFLLFVSVMGQLWTSFFKVVLSDWLCFPLNKWRNLKVHKSFSGRSERLLNVLCTFNLCLVFRRFYYYTGHSSVESDKLSKLRYFIDYIFLGLFLEIPQGQMTASVIIRVVENFQV